MAAPYPLALQLYSVREELKGDWPAVLGAVAEMGYQGVEGASLISQAPIEEVKSALDALGLQVASTGGRLTESGGVASAVERARGLGTRHLVTGLPKTESESLAQVLAYAEALRPAVAALKAEDLQLCLHNHYWEFDREFEGKTPHAWLMGEIPDICAELDTYWVQVGGRSAAAVIGAEAGRIPLLHIKDGPITSDKAIGMTAVGAGKMEWQPIVAAADPGMLRWLVVELDRCDTDMMEACAQSARFLIDQGFAQGRGVDSG